MRVKSATQLWNGSEEQRRLLKKTENVFCTQYLQISEQYRASVTRTNILLLSPKSNKGAGSTHDFSQKLPTNVRIITCC